MRVTTEEILRVYDDTQSVWKAGETLGIAGQTVHKHLTKAGRRPPSRWTPEEIDKLRRLVDDGRSSAEISLALGRSFAGVSCKLNELGLKVQRPKGVRTDPLLRRLTKEECLGHLQAMEQEGLAVTRYARRHHFSLGGFVAALQHHILDEWFEYCDRVSSLEYQECPNCQRQFRPLNKKQRCCTQRCTQRHRTNQRYFGGRRAATFGLEEGICYVCQDKRDKLSSHHAIGKEHDPDNEHLVAIDASCHRLVGILASKPWVEEDSSWQRLIELVILRSHGHRLATDPDYQNLDVSIYVEVRFRERIEGGDD